MSGNEFSWRVRPKSGGGDWELPPAGNLPAVCVALIDLGTQQDSFQGKPRAARQLALVWEIAGPPSSKTGEPHVVTQKFNASSDRDGTITFHVKSNLCKTLESWRGAPIRDDEDFDLANVVGTPCLLQISHNKTASGADVYIIDAVTALPRGMPRPQATYPPVCYRIDMGPDAIPTQPWLPMLYGKSIGDRVRECVEFLRGRPAGPAQGARSAAPAPAPPAQGARPAGAAPATAAPENFDEIPF